jgi:tetratricopeptide (TPR) repeat protein
VHQRKPLIAGLLAALVLGFAGVFWQWRRAEEQAAAARASAADAHEQRALAIAHLKTAEENFRQAYQAVDTFFTVAVANNLFNQPEYSPLHKRLLEEALRYYQGFIRQRADEPTLRAQLAEAYFRVGIITDARGDRSVALRALQQAGALYQALAREAPFRSPAGRLCLALQGPDREDAPSPGTEG